MAKTAIDEITVEGRRYVPADALPPREGPVRIVVLQRGWVAVGYFAQEGETCTLTRAAIIRVWGTTKGLGEIAAGGPTAKTVLDAAGTITFHVQTAVLMLFCNEASWASRL